MVRLIGSYRAFDASTPVILLVAEPAKMIGAPQKIQIANRQNEKR
jgi:hypothetical protein